MPLRQKNALFVWIPFVSNDTGTQQKGRVFLLDLVRKFLYGFFEN